MKAPLGALLACLLCAGCASPMVVLVAPGQAPAEDCYQACEAIFGLRPTLHCGARGEPPRRLLTCGYDHRFPAAAPAEGEAGDVCRAACARAGLEKVEACWPVTTRGGEPTVACRYQVPYH